MRAHVCCSSSLWLARYSTQRAGARRCGPSGASTFRLPDLQCVITGRRLASQTRFVLPFHLSTSVFPFPGRVSAPRFSAPVGGTLLRLRPPRSPLRRGWCFPTGSGDLNVASCMTPKVRFLDGVVCVLLCVELNPCRLHVVLLS